MLQSLVLKPYTRLQARYVTRDRERGATAVEYGIMVALIAVVIIAAVSALSGGISTTFNKITTKLGGQPPK